MKWLLLVLVVSCVGEKSSSHKANTVTQDPTSIEPKVCSPGALPEDYVRTEDYLAFPNFGYRGIGRCRGHALLTQKLLLLMRFDPTDPTPLDCDTDPIVCRKKVRSLLAQVEQGNAVVIPGFASLAEFSAHPVIKPILRGKIISYGHTYMANRLPLPGNEPRSVLVLKEAMKRVSLNQIPYLGIEGAQVGDHGVLGYDVTTKAGMKVLCIRDPNIVPAQGREECDNYMFQDESSVRYVRYARPEDTIRLEITDDEDRRINQYRRTLCR